jgi:hypothetical protein
VENRQVHLHPYKAWHGINESKALVEKALEVKYCHVMQIFTCVFDFSVNFHYSLSWLFFFTSFILCCAELFYLAHKLIDINPNNAVLKFHLLLLECD